MIHVTGASGGLARRVLERLAGRSDVTASSRTPYGFWNGIPVRRVDFDDPSAIESGLAGTEVLLLVSAGQGEDDVVIARHAAAIDAAERVGVRHIVYTSLTGAGDYLALAASHRWTERRLMSSAVDWTILRNGLYVELAVPDAVEAARTGVLRSPLGHGQWASVARDDLADVAANVLLDASSHRGMTYELVGGVSMSGKELARVAGKAAGREVIYEPTDLATFRTALADAGVPAWQIPVVVSAYSNIAADFLAASGGDLEKLLGTKARRWDQVIIDAVRSVTG
jgi:NAD(P)H dehydrogenase (quinone)